MQMTVRNPGHPKRWDRPGMRKGAPRDNRDAPPYLRCGYDRRAGAFRPGTFTAGRAGAFAGAFRAAGGTGAGAAARSSAA